MLSLLPHLTITSTGFLYPNRRSQSTERPIKLSLLKKLSRAIAIKDGRYWNKTDLKTSGTEDPDMNPAAMLT
jgi:hypothetical protein